jgi:hypothetical protein
MAQRTQLVLISDLTGDEIRPGNGQSIEFAYRGVEYRIDLTDKEAAGFDRAIAMYLEHATRVGGRRAGRRASGGAGATKTDREQLDAMRRWARDNGYKVSGRGRVSREVQDAFHAAHR